VGEVNESDQHTALQLEQQLPDQHTIAATNQTADVATAAAALQANTVAPITTRSAALKHQAQQHHATAPKATTVVEGAAADASAHMQQQAAPGHELTLEPPFKRARTHASTVVTPSQAQTELEHQSPPVPAAQEQPELSTEGLTNLDPAALPASAPHIPGRLRALQKAARINSPGRKRVRWKLPKHSSSTRAGLGSVEGNSQGGDWHEQSHGGISGDSAPQHAGVAPGNTANVPTEHRMDRMLVQSEFLRLQQLSGKAFTVDCFCREDGTNSHCSQFYSPADSFFRHSLAGQHCWINPPFNMIRETLQHYQSCKARAPDSTSAVFCLPKVSARNPPDWAHLVKGMQVLHTYRRGTKLFTGPNPDNEQQRHLLPGIPFDIAIYYDGPSTQAQQLKVQLQPTAQGTVRLKTSHVMQVPVTLAGVQAVALLDTGAERTPIAPDGIFVSQLFAHRHGFVVKPTTEHLQLSGIDGQSCAVYGTTRCTLKVGQLVSQVTAVVIEMDTKLDIILGETWLEQHKAVLDYGSKACMFMRRGKRCLVRCIKPRSVPSESNGTPNTKILTVTQAKRVLSKRVWYCLALVRKIDEQPVFYGDDSADLNTITDPRVQTLVKSYPTVFTDGPPQGGSQIQAPYECIPLAEGSKPTFRPMYRYSPLEMAELERRIKDLLEKGYIEPSTSPYGAPVLFVKKPRSEELRLVIDYRMINKLTIKNKYPLPRIDDMLDALSGSTVFSSIDLRQAYHQIKLVDTDRPKTAFRTPFGHYQWVTLSMGLTNAPAVFQSVVNDIFRPYLGKFVVVYLDDICIHSKTEEEHIKHLQLVLDKLKEAKLTAAWHKCRFFEKQLLFVGHTVSAEGIRADPAKVEAVTQYPRPTDQHQLRSFLGMTNFFRRYIHRYAAIVQPLNNLLRKDRAYEWQQPQEEAFNKVKQALASAPVLKLPDWQSDTPFELITDASLAGLAGVLMQDGHPIAFESRKLNSAEQNYSPTELEMLAVVHCIKTWRCYIEGKEVHVFTDHKPNTTFISNPMANRRQARWTDELQGYNIEWHYKPGSQNCVADALSRHPVKEAPPITATFVSNPVYKARSKSKGNQRAKQLQSTTTFLDKCREGYKLDPWFADTANVQHLTIADGIYTLADSIVVPNYADLREQILKECHDAPYAAHPGREKTLHLIKQMFWWPTLASDVAKYVKSCPQCQRNKNNQRLPAGLLQPLPIPEEAWQSISMDMVTDLPETPQGYDSITVFVDRLTKMVHLAPCKKTDTAKDIAQLFLREVFRLHGVPSHMVTDRDPKFTSIFWKEFFTLLGDVNRSLTSAYHPQTDGNTERVNRVMEDMLRHFVTADQTNWDTLLPMVEFAINNSHHESIKTTPFLLNYGRTPKTPLFQAVHRAGHKGRRDAPGVKQFIQELQDAQNKAKQCLYAAQQRQKAYADNRRRPAHFAIGQQVLLSTKNILLRMVGSAKLLPKFIGPFKITDKINETAYRLELPPCLKIHNVFHVSLIKEYHDNGRYQPPPPPELIDQELEYEVEAILYHRNRKVGKRGKRTRVITEYLVKWKGYDVEHNTWEPETNCQNCHEMVQQYWDSVAARAEAKQQQPKLTSRNKRKKR